MQDTTTPAKRFQCRHIHAEGHRCGSPCLRGEEFCYFHHTTRKPIPQAELEQRNDRKARQAAFDLPLPEDRGAIQLSIGEVLRRIAANTIDSRRAGLLLYGLQIASLNLPKATPATRHEAEDLPEIMEEVIQHPTYGSIAPESEVIEPKERLSLAGLLLREFEDEDASEQQTPIRTLRAAATEDSAQVPPRRPTRPRRNHKASPLPRRRTLQLKPSQKFHKPNNEATRTTRSKAPNTSRPPALSGTSAKAKRTTRWTEESSSPRSSALSYDSARQPY